jgi:hypothetical protein
VPVLASAPNLCSINSQPCPPEAGSGYGEERPVKECKSSNGGKDGRAYPGVRYRARDPGLPLERQIPADKLVRILPQQRPHYLWFINRNVV